VALLNLGLFASGNGTNLQAIVDACSDGTIDAKPTVVIGNNSTAFAFERARKAGIDVVHLSSKTHPDPDELDEAILRALRDHDVELIALAGYNKRLGPRTISEYRNRIVNTHSGLLPKYGGQGMYGVHIHQAVIENGEAETGVTVHLVDEEYDHGQVLMETRVPVLPGDTAESLWERVKMVERPTFVETLRRIASGELPPPENA
jgi:phosphoribosylglycinamide formyltransferase 1